MDLGLADTAAVCTAASSGLGFASARALAAEGADVAVCGTTPEHVDEAREELEDTGDGDVLAVEADVTDPDEIQAYVEEAADSFEGIDHLVTSAPGPPSGPFLEMDDDDWYQAYDGLVMAPVRALRAATPHLRAGDGGTWTAIASGTVKEVSDGLVLSNAVRRGVIGLMKTTSRELTPEIRSNAVLPGAHETGRIEDLIEAAVDRGEVPDYESGYESWASDVPLERIGEPGELGDVVAFLASDRASFVNGAAIPIDGGSLRGA